MYEEIKNATVKDMGGTRQMMDVLRGGKKGISVVKKSRSRDSSRVASVLALARALRPIAVARALRHWAISNLSNLT